MTFKIWIKKISLPIKQKILPEILYRIFYYFDISCKVTKIKEPTDITGAKIYACWHGRQYCFLKICDRDKLTVLISQSRDGEIVTKILLKMGFKVIRGSSSRGGMMAIKQMLRSLEAEENIAFTVDGPRGPIFSVNTGVIKLAQLSGVPIVPVIPTTNIKYIAKSWDKYNIPWFFNKVNIYYGKPIYVDKDADEEKIEKKRQELYEEMKNLTLNADKDSNNVTEAIEVLIGEQQKG